MKKGSSLKPGYKPLLQSELLTILLQSLGPSVSSCLIVAGQVCVSTSTVASAGGGS